MESGKLFFGMRILRFAQTDITAPRQGTVLTVPKNPPFSFDMYPHFFDGAKKRRYPSKKRVPTPAVCSRKRCPLHKGTKALHQKNGGSDSRPPSFRPTAVFILHLPPGYFRLFFDGMGFSPHPSRLYYLWRATFPQGEGYVLRESFFGQILSAPTVF